MANQFLALSLFIMLLSFFIILNSMSTFEESKIRPIMNSLTLAFNDAEVNPLEMQANIVSDPAESFNTGNTIERIEGLFNAEIPNIEVKKNRLGTTMQLTLSVEKFESLLKQDNTKNISSPDGEAQFSKILIGLLESWDNGIPYQMDMILNTPDSPSKLKNAGTEDINNDLRKVASYALFLQEFGLPKQYITAGLAKGEDGMIDLHFRRYENFQDVEKPDDPQDNQDDEVNSDE